MKVPSLLALAVGLPALALAAPFFSEDFEVDPTAEWTVNNGPSDEAHNFFFDYSTVGIPLSPGSMTSGRRGMKLQANQSSGIFSGMSVSPTGQNFPGDYKVVFDWWANFNGPFPVGGSGSNQLSTFGVGTSGTVAQWIGGTQDSIWFGGTGDGGSSSDWRAYSPTAPVRYADSAPGIYAAGTAAGSSNSSNPYYASFGQNVAPAAQVALFPQQSGTTQIGSAGMEWHRVEIQKAGGSVTWKVDGLLIATVPVADDTVATGNNIFFGHSDVNATSSTDPNDGALLFTLIDNVYVVPSLTAVSRKLHGASVFDIELPLAGAPGIECRTGGTTNDYQIVVTFPTEVAVTGNPQAQVTSGSGQVGTGGASNGGMVNVKGSVVTIPLTNVTSGQTITVTLFGANAGAGPINVMIPMGVLVGDVTANGTVNASDVGLTKSNSGQNATASNFRADVTAGGSINASDVGLVKSRSGTAIP